LPAQFWSTTRFFVLSDGVSSPASSGQEARQEREDAPPGFPFYGNTVVGPPGEWTWLRIVKRGDSSRAYTSADGESWIRGGVWTHVLGADASIGLVSIGGAGFTARFDYVRAFELAGP
jgi:arabinan endo-1,5-alpha-L-arabinosidase